jgi:hypothetical protein
LIVIPGRRIAPNPESRFSKLEIPALALRAMPE